MKARDTGRPRNVQAMLDWCKEHRPDCLDQIEMISHGAGGDAAILLLSIGFESGREFQKDNPSIPLGGGAHYLPKDLRPVEFV